MNAAITVVKPETVILATDERYVKDEPTIMILNEKISFSGSCVIKDANKEEYFKCKDKSILFSDGKILKDMDNNPVIGIKNDSLIGFKKEVYNPNKNNKAVAKVSKDSILTANGLAVSFHNRTNHKNETLVMKFFNGDKNCDIYYGKGGKAPLVGKIQFKSPIVGRDKYYLEIAPNVDIALMTSLVIIFDANIHE